MSLLINHVFKKRPLNSFIAMEYESNRAGKDILVFKDVLLKKLKDAFLIRDYKVEASAIANIPNIFR